MDSAKDMSPEEWREFRKTFVDQVHSRLERHILPVDKVAPNLESSAAEANPAPSRPGLHLIVELFGSDLNGRKMIAWGRRVGCRDVGHGFEPGGRGVYTRLLVDDGNPQQHNFLMELVDYPAGLRAINPADPDTTTRN